MRLWRVFAVKPAPEVFHQVPGCPVSWEVDVPDLAVGRDHMERSPSRWRELELVHSAPLTLGELTKRFLCFGRLRSDWIVLESRHRLSCQAKPFLSLFPLLNKHSTPLCFGSSSGSRIYA